MATGACRWADGVLEGVHWLSAAEHHGYRAAWSLAPYIPAVTLQRGRVRDLEVTYRLAKLLWARDQAPLAVAVGALNRWQFVRDRCRPEGFAAQLVDAFATAEAASSEQAFLLAKGAALAALAAAREAVDGLLLAGFLNSLRSHPAIGHRLGSVFSGSSSGKTVQPSSQRSASPNAGSSTALGETCSL